MRGSRAESTGSVLAPGRRITRRAAIALIAGAAVLAVAGVMLVPTETGALSASASAFGPGPVPDMGTAGGPATRTVDTPTAYPPSAAERTTSIESLVRSGVAGPDRGIPVANLTITPGQYYVGYSYRARVDSAFTPVTLRCGLVDSNGVDRFIADDPVVVESGAGWSTHEQITTFNLGDVTLGIRCDPDTVGLYRAEFSDLDLWVVRMPFEG